MKAKLFALPFFLAAMFTPLPAVAQRYSDSPGAWHHDFGAGHMLFGGLMMFLVLGAIVVLIVLLVRSASGSDASSRIPGHKRSPLDILDERYARGEIDRDEYHQRRQDLGGQ